MVKNSNPRRGGAGIVVLAVLGIVCLIGAILALTVISFKNRAVGAENAVKMQFQDNQNRYDSFWKQVRETAQVADGYKEDFKQVMVASIQGRYQGKDPMLLFIQEKNPQLDPKLYTRIQDVIESGRNDFKRSQTDLLDRQRRYATTLQEFPGSVYAGWLGLPTELHGPLAPPADLDGDGKLTVLDYPIVTSAKTKDAFQKGEDDEVDVFGRKKQ